MEASRTIVPVIQSQGITCKSIAVDVIKLVHQVVSSIESSEDPRPTEVLLFIDATNGHLTSSGYWFQSDETHQASFVDLELEILWQYIEGNGYNSNGFDVIVRRAIKRAFRTKGLRQLMKSYTFIIEDELGDRTQIRIRNLLTI